jgi:hypothetical protein
MMRAFNIRIVTLYRTHAKDLFVSLQYTYDLLKVWDSHNKHSCVCCDCPILSIYCSVNTAGMNKLKITYDRLSSISRKRRAVEHA